MFSQIREVRKNAMCEVAKAKAFLKVNDPKKPWTREQGEKVMDTLVALHQTKRSYEKYGTNLLKRIVRFFVCRNTMHKVNKVSQFLVEPIKVQLLNPLRNMMESRIKEGSINKAEAKRFTKISNNLVNVVSGYFDDLVNKCLIPEKLGEIDQDQIKQVLINLAKVYQSKVIKAVKLDKDFQKQLQSGEAKAFFDKLFQI